MRKSILRFGALALMSLMSIGAFAQGFNEKGYQISDNGNVYAVVDPDPTGTADDRDFGTVKLLAAGDKITAVGTESITVNMNEYKCTEIDGNAFKYKSPSELTIGADVTTIGAYAFSYLDADVTITFASGANLESIGAYAFCAIYHEKGGDAKKNGYTTGAITVSVDEAADGNSYSKPTLDLSKISDVNKLGNAAFQNVNFKKKCDNDKKSEVAVAAVKLGALEYIPSELFQSSRDLKSIYFTPAVNNTLTYVGKSAFYGCSSLENFGYVEASGDVYLPAGLNKIENSAFYLCSALKAFQFSVTATDSKITTVGQRAFYYCTWLNTDKFLKLFPVEKGSYNPSATEAFTSIKFTDNNFTFGSSSFQGTGVDGCLDFTRYSEFGITFNTAFQSTKVDYVLLPGDKDNSSLYVTTIENNALNGCTSLKAVYHLDRVTNIGDNAFGGCTSLATCDLPNGLETIGARAFKSAPAYTTINIPNTVTFIGEDAFNSNITSGTRIIQILPKESATNNDVSQVIRSTRYVDASGTPGQSGYTPAHYEEADPVGNYTNTKLIVPMGLMKAYATASIPTPEQKQSTAAQNFYDWSKAAGALYTYSPIGVTDVEGDDDAYDYKLAEGQTFYNGCYQYTVVTGWCNKYNATGWSETPKVKLTGINTGDVAKKPNAGSEYTAKFSGTELNLPKTVVREGENTQEDRNIFVWYNLTAVDQAALASVKNAVETVNIQADALDLGAGDDEGAKGAFEGFTKLSAVNFGAIATSNNTGWYGDNATAPKTVTLGKNAFYGCKNLVSFNVGNIVKYGTTIGESAFNGAAKLDAFTIPASVTTINANAFTGTALTSINIPASVTTIGQYAFDGAFENNHFKGVSDVYVNWGKGKDLSGIDVKAFGNRLPIVSGLSVTYMTRRLYTPVNYTQEFGSSEPAANPFVDGNKFKLAVAVIAKGAKNAAADGRIDIKIDEFGKSSLRIEDNADITDFQILKGEEDVDVTYVRIVQEDAVNKPAPLFVPFSIEQGDPAECGYQIYQVFDTKVYDDKSEGIEYVKVEEGEFTNPNVPYVFYPANTVTEFKATGYITTDLAAGSIFECSNAASSYEFYGTYATATAEKLTENKTMYGLTTKGRFAKVEYIKNKSVVVKKDEIKALRFYMLQESKKNPYDKQAAQEVKFIILDDEDVTAIENVKANSLNAPMFDLQGRQIAAPAKGQVYIQNGVKKLAK